MELLEIFEVDHPASQAWKRARVGELGIAEPVNLHHVAIDFERQALGAGLAASVVDLGRPVFLSLLGVTQYLTKYAVLAILRDLAAMAALGSELVLQFQLPIARLERDDAALLTAWVENGRAAGEPWLSFFDPEEMERYCLDCGFSKVVHFGPEEAMERYLRGRAEQLRVPAHFRLIKARIE